MSRPAFLYDNRLDDGTPVASTTETGFDVLNLRDWKPYTFWKPTAVPATVTVDAGVPRPTDYALLWGHNLYSSNVRFDVEHSSDNFVADTTTLSYSAESDKPLAVYFTEVTKRYWRLALSENNLLTRTEEFDHADWSLLQASLEANAVLPPGALTAAYRLTQVTDAFDNISQDVTLTASTNHRMSIFAKPDDTVDSLLRIQDLTAGSELANIRIGWVNGVPSTASSLGASNITYEDQGDGWYRCGFQFTTSVNTSFQVQIQPDRDALGRSLFVTGAHVHAGTPNFFYNPVGAGTQLIPTIAIASIGKLLEMPAGLPQRFDPTMREPQGRLSRSAAGHPLGRTTDFEMWDADLRFRWASKAFVRGAWRTAWDSHMRDNPFVFAWDRGNYPEELFLVNQTRGYTSPHSSGDVVEIVMKVEGLALE
ncbi:MAG: hypothetical protein QNJ62_06560 [Methyloceanibacter sp.]|nr:hypothetical protein [Methyloceanibacter sp.]